MICMEFIHPCLTSKESARERAKFIPRPREMINILNDDRHGAHKKITQWIKWCKHERDSEWLSLLLKSITYKNVIRIHKYKFFLTVMYDEHNDIEYEVVAYGKDNISVLDALEGEDRFD